MPPEGRESAALIGRAELIVLEALAIDQILCVAAGMRTLDLGAVAWICDTGMSDERLALTRFGSFPSHPFDTELYRMIFRWSKVLYKLFSMI